MSGTCRALSPGTPAPTCQEGFVKNVLAPPPVAEGCPSATLSFQEISGMYEIADAPLGSLAAFQNCPEPSENSVPPTDVTSGMLPGISTESPGFCGSSQSAPPA